MDFEHIFKIMLTKHVKNFDSRETLMIVAFSRALHEKGTKLAGTG